MGSTKARKKKAPAKKKAKKAAGSSLAKLVAAGLADLNASGEDLPKTLAAALEEVTALAAKSAPKAAKKAKSVAKKTGAKAEAMRFLDAAAMAILAHDDKRSSRQKQASACHAAARVVERKLKRSPIADDARLPRLAALAERGALWAKELAMALDAMDEVPATIAATIAQQVVANGEEPSLNLMKALARHGAAEAALRAWLAAPGALADIDAKLWTQSRAMWVRAVAQSDEHQRQLACFSPRTNDPTGFLRILAEADVARAIDTPAFARGFAQRVLQLSMRSRCASHGAEIVGYVSAILAPLARLLREAEPLSLEVSTTGYQVRFEYEPHELPDVPSYHALLAPELTEVLLELELPFTVPDQLDRFEMGGAGTEEDLGLEHQQLRRVAAHDELRPRLERGLYRALWNTQSARLFLRAAASEGQRTAMGQVLGLVSDVATKGTIGTFESFHPTMARLCEPDVLKGVPELADIVGSLDPVELFRRQLQHGSMDEWGWEALDAVVVGPRALTGNDVRRHVVGTLPECVLHERDDERARLLVVGPDDVHFELELTGEDQKRAFRWVHFLNGELYAYDWRTNQVLALVRGEVVAEKGPQPLLGTMVGGELLDVCGRNLRALLEAGESIDIPSDLRLHVLNHRIGLLSDGEHLYRADRERSNAPYEVERFDGGEPARPAWLAEGMVEGALLFDVQSWPVPEGSEESPVGIRDGVAGFARIELHGNGMTFAADGRRGKATGLNLEKGWQRDVTTLITFPKRDAVHPVTSLEEAVFHPDLDLPLTAPQDCLRAGYWPGTTFRPPQSWWPHLRARDPDGSAALAECSRGRAHELYEAATAALAEGPKEGEHAEADELVDYEDLRVIIERPPPANDPIRRWPSVASAVRQIFPEITHPRLVAGIAGLAITAAEQGRRIAELQATVARQLASDATQSHLVNADLRAIDRLLGCNLEIPGRWGRNRVGQQIHDVASYLLGDAAGELERPAPGFMAWESALTWTGDFVMHLLAAGTPEPARAAMRTLLEELAATVLPDHANELHWVAVQFDEAPFSGVDHDAGERLATWTHRTFLRVRDLRQHIYVGLVRRKDSSPLAPPGAKVLEEHAVSPWFARERLEAALAAERWAPMDRATIDAVANATGLMAESVRLLLNGGAPPLELDGGARKTAGLTVGKAAHATEELAPTATAGLFGSFVGDDLKPAPTATILKRCVERFGVREPLAMDVLEQAKRDIRNPHPPFARVLRELLSPESTKPLAADASWVVRPYVELGRNAIRFGSKPPGWPIHHDASTGGFRPQWPDASRAFSYDALTSYPKYFAWAQLELPVGHRMRLAAHRASVFFRERLRHPDLLIPLAMGEGERPFDDGEPYAAADGGDSAEGLRRDGLLLTWPSKGEGWMLYAVPAELEGAPAIPTNAVDVWPYAHLLTLVTSAAFTRLMDALGAAAPEGAMVADPRVSAPDAVARTMAAESLERDAAALLLQLRALGEPTRARLRGYGWPDDALEKASDELVARGLVERTKRRGSTRTLYLSERLVSFDRYPAPVEASKLAYLQLTEDERPPLDVPLPCEPLGELYERIASAIATR